MIVKPYLGKATTDLNEAKDALGAAWSADDRVAILRLATASAALVRAVQNVSCAVERLADCVDAPQTEPPQPRVSAR
jgi:hypothetical protein